MKIAIHHSEGGFSDRWIAYCKRENFAYKIVNAFDSNIIQQVKDCNVFMWHHHHAEYKDVTAAKKILFALDHAGVKVFPDFKTGWHFDDKVAQKYLLEAIEAPLVPSYVFYDKNAALEWCRSATYPKVFKLKGGAGSANVRLVKSEKEAVKLIEKAFHGGFPQFDRVGHLKERYINYRSGRDTLNGVLKAIGRLFIATDFDKQQPNERGYVYFQDFMPKNDFDLRVIVIGRKAFALKRMVRENDFRASGSGKIIYAREDLDENAVKIAFEVNDKIQAQSIAYDFVYDENDELNIVEISYGYAVTPYDQCPGYWDAELKWHKGKFNPQEWIVDELINEFETD